MNSRREQIIKEGQQQIAIKEIAKRLNEHQMLKDFVTELAEWNATCDSWYDLFKYFQDKAIKVL